LALAEETRMREIVRSNGLSLALFALFLVSIVGQAFAGWYALGDELAIENHPAPDFRSYLSTGHFLAATFENWESEFLQMSVYVVLTAVLIQKGSPESRPLDESPKELEAKSTDAPWPVRKGGLWLRLYAHSLSITLLALFGLSFWLHLLGSTRHANEEALLHAGPVKTAAERLVDPEFWYESFQNWQSEFLSIGALVVLAIFLRERGSPESKPVQASHSQTG
jgi:hypothetical protein